MNYLSLRKIIKALLYIVIFVPLIIFSDFLSPFHFGKVIVFRSLVELMAALYLVLAWHEPAYRPKLNPILWAFTFFTLAFTVTTITSIQAFQSFWGTLERMGGLWTFWHYFVFYIILVSVLKTKEEWFKLLKIMIGVGIVSAFYGFGQKTDISFFIGSGQRARIFGTIGNAALFAGYQLINVFLALTLYFRPQNTNREKSFFSLAVLIMSVAVLMTAVRGSVLALGVGFILFAWLRYHNYNTQKARKVFLALILLLIIFVGLALSLRSTSFVQNSGYLMRVTDFSLSSFTVKTRFWAWKAGFEGWKESFKTIIFGYGPENFNIPFSKHFNPKFFTGLGSETLFDRAHNMFVEILVTMGLLGLLTYVWLIFKSLLVLWKNFKTQNNTYAAGFISLVVVYIIHNSFIFDTSANFIAFFTVLGFITYLYFVHSEENNKSSITLTRSNLPVLRFTAVLLLVVGSMFVIYKTSIFQSKANYGTTRAIVAGWNKDFNDSVARYKEVMPYDVAGKYEFRHRYAQYVLEQASSKDKLTPEITVALKDVIIEVTKNEKENPHDYLPELYLSRLNILLGRYDPSSPFNNEALKHGLKALEISPTFIRTYYEVAQAYLDKKDNEKAIEYFKKAADLNPEVGLSFWYWGAVELQRGNVDKGLELVNKSLSSRYGYSATEQDYLKIINVYFKRNDFINVVKWYEYLIKVKPDEAQYRASLAVAYSKIGKIDEAVDQAREAARLDTAFEAEANAFVRSLGRNW